MNQLPNRLKHSVLLVLVFGRRLEHHQVTPDRLADLEPFLRVQGGMGCRYLNHNLSLTVHYLLQMVRHLHQYTSTRYLQALAAKALGSLHHSHRLNNNNSRRKLLRSLVM